MTSTLTTVVNAALLGIRNKAGIHYTQDSPARWSGIHDKLVAAKGQYPHYADCSSFATWCLWQVLGSGPDIVNGTGWRSGYTGTLSQHGHSVSAASAQAGDLVFYGHPIYHVAIVIGRKDGHLIVASHGEESGPYVVRYDQWPVNSIRRYLPTAPKPAPAPAPAVAGAPWPWPSSNSVDVLGNVANPSNHVHGGDPRYDPPSVTAAVKSAQTKFIQLGLKTGYADGTWGVDDDAACLAYRAKYDPAAKGVKTLGSLGYSNLLKTKKK